MLTASTAARPAPRSDRQLAPVAALAGVSEGDAEKLAAAFGINTVRDLGTNKYFTLAQALVAVGGHPARRAVRA